MFENLANLIFPNSAYGYRSEDILKTLDTVTPEKINEFYKTLLSHPKDTLIVIAGQFNPKTIDSQLKPLTSLFKSTKQNNSIKFTALAPAQNKGTLKIQKPKQAATWIGYGWQGATVDKPQEYAALKILSNLLGGGFTSRMFDTMRNKNGVAYETAAIYAGKKLSASMTAYIGTDPNNEEKVLGLLDAILTDLRINPVDSKELEASKSEYIGEFFLAHEKVADQANFLGIYESLGAGFGYDDKLPKLIEKLKSMDIQTVAKKYLGVPAVKVIVSPQSIRTENE
jgi:zinc protease